MSLGLDAVVYVADVNSYRGSWSYGEATSVIGLPSALAISELSAAGIGWKLHVIDLRDERLYVGSGDYGAGFWAGGLDLTSAAGPLGPIDDVSAVAIGNKLHLYALSRRWMY
ncbi:hypothetical protein, partial [Streptomyces sp. BE303]|uniref:hypothetical protein n=1 Tax=Streptomyces sp. BE303 TaxID=3002528 RepID=UPI002E77A7AA